MCTVEGIMTLPEARTFHRQLQRFSSVVLKCNKEKSRVKGGIDETGSRESHRMDLGDGDFADFFPFPGGGYTAVQTVFVSNQLRPGYMRRCFVNYELTVACFDPASCVLFATHDLNECEGAAPKVCGTP